MLVRMSTVQEIKAAIEALTPTQRAELERSLYAPADPVAESSVVLPDYAARRRRIFGDRVLPNMVLEAREAENT